MKIYCRKINRNANRRSIRAGCTPRPVKASNIQMDNCYKIMTWDEFREYCYEDAYNWYMNGDTTDTITAEDVIREYPDDYFDDEWQETDDLSSCFTPADFAYQTLEYLDNLVSEESVTGSCGKKSVKSSRRKGAVVSSRKRSGRKAIKATYSGKIPYDLVSMLLILRDWADVEDGYINSEHKALVDIADTLYNVGRNMVNQLSPEFKAVYDKYGKDYFDQVLDDASAIDSQINSRNVNDLIAEYNDKAEEF